MPILIQLSANSRQGAMSRPFSDHSSDYHLAVLEGEMKHWPRGDQEAEAPVLGPGSGSSPAERRMPTVA